MKICYDLHIHSALSPCADNDMTPINIVAAASAVGLEMLSITDHNAIENVAAAMLIGEALGVTVVPGIEVQTSEEIHFVCYFETLNDLRDFYSQLSFVVIKNRPEIFGEQLIINEDDEIVGTVERLLITSCHLSESDIFELVRAYNGIAIPAHIDRDSNGIIAILGVLPKGYPVVELSEKSGTKDRRTFEETHKVIIGSDSHTLASVGQTKNLIELEENTPKALLKYLKGTINL